MMVDPAKICYLLESGGWRSDHFEGAWIGKTAGGCRYNQEFIEKEIYVKSFAL